MKRILLLFTIACFILSCDSENNPTDVNLLTPPPVKVDKFLKANVNGTDIMFDETNVQKQIITEAGVVYTDLIVTANKRNDTSAKVVFKLEHMRTGLETCYYFLYNVGDIEYDIETGNSFHVNVTNGTENNIKGTFSGTLKDFEGNSITLNNGHFDISF